MAEMDYLTIVVDPAGEATVLNSSEEYRAMFNPDADADTGFGPQIDAQAWSEGEQPTEPMVYRERHSWAAVWRWAAVAVGVGVTAAGVLLAMGGFRSSASEPVTVAHTAAPAPTFRNTIDPTPPAPTALPDVPDAMTVTREGEYFQKLRAIGFDFTDTQAVISDAQVTCSNLLITPSRTRLAQWAWRNDPTIPPGTTLEQVTSLINAQADYACPER